MAIKLEITPGFHDFVYKINHKIPFTFARYGDGEWACILGMRGENCDGVKYTEQMQDLLRATLFEPRDYYYGMLKIALQEHSSSIEAYLVVNEIDIPWIEGTGFVKASRHGNLFPVVEALRKRKIIYVGPTYMRAIEGSLFKFREYIDVDPVNALKYLYIYESQLRDVANKGDLIGISMGPAAKVFIWWLHELYGKTHTIIDFGSLWDGFLLGHESRKYMREGPWNTTKIKNLNP